MKWWGIRCKGCDNMHPIAMHVRTDKTSPRFKKDERFGYRCFRNGKRYSYVGAEQQIFDYTDASVRDNPS